MKNLIIVIVLLLLVAFGIYYYVSSGSAVTQSSPLVASGLAGETGTAFSGADFLRTLDNLQSLKLDDKIFSSAVFSGLVDFSVPLQPEPKGRINPFQPIGVEQL
jgi:hypothetical protein